MKKILVCLLLVAAMCLPVLTGCSDDTAIDETTTKPLTITLYGITGETTTAEAIQAVQDKINEYTEGKFNTHIILRLFPEAQYYTEIESRLAEIEKRLADEAAAAKKRKEEERAAKRENRTLAPETTVEAVTTDAETYVENGAIKTVYPAEKNTQVDIFMVQGASKLNQYFDNGWLSSLSDALANDSKVLYNYIATDLLDAAKLEVTVESDYSVSRGSVYGIPNNNIFGEYVYLLVNKEIAERFYYKPEDVSTLGNLQYFLMDAARDYPDYITLYNNPTFNIEYFTESESLVGGMITNTSKIYSRSLPRDILNITSYTNARQYMYTWNDEGYIVEGDYYSLPEDRQVAAAFIKGDITTPEKYEDDYYVITYQNPTATRNDRPGTMFCVSAYTSNVNRCMQIITALQTVKSFRDTFQYGVEGVHYTTDEYTGIVTYLNQDYSMNPADTGNLFIMTPNTDMSEYMLKMSENNWALAKQHNRNVINSPYVAFPLQIVTKDNYKTVSKVWKEMYNAAYAQASQAEGFDESKFVFDEPYPYEYTDVILEKLQELSEEYIQKISEFKEYVDEEGNTVTLKDYIKKLRIEFDASEYYKMYVDASNGDSPYAQYNSWYAKNGPQTSM